MLARTTALVLSAALLAAPALAAPASVTIEADREETTLADGVVVTLKVSGSDADEPTPPQTDAFDIFSRGQSRQVQIINGSMSSSTTYTFVLQPKKLGAFALPPFRVKVGGRVIETRSLQLRVVADSRSPASADNTVFITAEVSKQQPFVGEPMVYTYKVLRRVQIAQYSEQLPKFDGFVAEDWGERKEYNQTIEGNLYNVTELKKILFPLQPGATEIPGVSANVEMVLNNGARNSDPFGGFFATGPTRPKSLRTDPIKVQVQALPPAPSDYAGLVGHFTLQSSISKTAIAVGESATWRLEISGNGNVRSLRAPAAVVAAALKVYPEQPKVEERYESGAWVAKALVQQALVALAPGEIAVPDLTMSYFDTYTGRYESLRAPGFTLQISGVAAEPFVPPPVVDEAATPTPKQPVADLAPGLLPSHRSAGALRTRDFYAFLHVGVFVLGWLLPALSFSVWLWRRRQRLLGASNPAAYRRRKALANAQEVLQKAAQAARNGDSRDAVTLSSRAIRDYLGDKFGVVGAAHTALEIGTLLRQYGARSDLVARVETEMMQLEASQYGGSAVQAPQVQSLMDTLKALEQQL